jgi:hypothetical protein
LGRDYPLGYDYFRKRLKKAFSSNINLKDENEISKAVQRGEYVLKELDALYKLRKYRFLKKHYYEVDNELETRLSKIETNTSDSK